MQYIVKLFSRSILHYKVFKFSFFDNNVYMLPIFFLLPTKITQSFEQVIELFHKNSHYNRSDSFLPKNIARDCMFCTGNKCHDQHY